MTIVISKETAASRIARSQQLMVEHGIDVLLLSVGHDLPYLVGYDAMPLERLTMLVVPQQGEAQLVIPRLEAARVNQLPGVFSLIPWDETDDPIAIVASHVRNVKTAAVGDQMWSRFLVDLIKQAPHLSFSRASEIVGALRIAKDRAELDALLAAGAAADRVAAQLHAGQIPLVGRTEAQVSADISARLITEGHNVVNFAIVAAGKNAASPHHHPGPQVIQRDEIVLCDFGGTMNGYCSDITRCVFTGKTTPDVAAAYQVLKTAQAASVRSAVVGATCESVDEVARDVISAAGFGELFMHRTGHGIGMEAHEDPYIVAGNTTLLEAGHVFSIEPGIYLSGKWGMRLEDIVIASPDGPISVNNALHDLVEVDC